MSLSEVQIRKKIKKCFLNDVAALPKSKIVRIRNHPIVSYKDCRSAGPYKIAFQGELFSANCFSTYPFKNNKKDGEPIADRYSVKMYENCIISCIADGCGWGEKSRKASTVAINFLEKAIHTNELGPTVRDIGNQLVEITTNIHFNICKHVNATTTFLVVVIVELEEGGWYGINLSIGDCSLFSLHNNTTTRISGNVRKHLKEMSSMDGRIGKNSNCLMPELKISSLNGFKCCSNDVITLMSDGLADNLDPMIIGVDPKQLSLSNWKVETALLKREEYVLNTLSTCYKESSCLNDYIEHLTSECVENTKPVREFVQNNKGRLPDDPTKVPGKVDHVSVVSIRVGEICYSEMSTVKLYEVECCMCLLGYNTFKPIVTTGGLKFAKNPKKHITKSNSTSGLSLRHRRFSIQSENPNLNTSSLSSSPCLLRMHSPSISLSPRILSPRRSPSSNGSPLLIHTREMDNVARNFVTPTIHTTDPLTNGLNDNHPFVRYFLPCTLPDKNGQD
ncbi:PPM-type phosphatase domain-containing protein [Entamoeba marina]